MRNFQHLLFILPVEDMLRLIGPFNRVLTLCLSLKDSVRLLAKIPIISVTNLGFTTAGLRADKKRLGSFIVELISVFDALLNTRLPEFTGVSRTKLGQCKHTRTVVNSLPGN